MKSHLISVVIPVYNQAEFVAEAISSVLEQTYTHSEILVINDGSPDNASEIVSEFDDPRVKLIVHEKNRGLPAARNTGILASNGEIIALLDSDDMFHPEKLESHLYFLTEHPEIGVSYNNRFELDYSASTIREIWSPPPVVTLKDFVCGFPISPSDMVLRREWAFKVNLFREEFTSGGEDLDFLCQLALAGCKFANVDRALNYRRYHSGRPKKRLSCRLDDYTTALESTFSDPRCPEDIMDLRDIAYASFFLEVAYYALLQKEFDLGQEILCKAIHFNPSLLTGYPSSLVQYLLDNAIDDEYRDHEKLLTQIMSHLPPEIAWQKEQYDWAVARGYLLRGTRAILWGRDKVGDELLTQADSLEAEIDEPFMRQLSANLLNYESEFGAAAVEEFFRKISPYIERIGNRANIQWLKSCYLFNQGLQYFQREEYSKVPKTVIHAMMNNPEYITNIGAQAILVRSLFKRSRYLR